MQSGSKVFHAGETHYKGRERRRRREREGERERGGKGEGGAREREREEGEREIGEREIIMYVYKLIHFLQLHKQGTSRPQRSLIIVSVWDQIELVRVSLGYK